MRTRHLIARSGHYRFVCRVPRDIIHLFPTSTIWKTLKANDERSARLLAAMWEQRTQELFLRLRTAMLPKDIERLLIAKYLKDGADSLETRAKDRSIADDGTQASAGIAHDAALEAGFAALGTALGLSPREARKRRATFLEESAEEIADLVAGRDASLFGEALNALAESLKKTYEIAVSPQEIASAIIPLMNAQKKLLAADSAIQRGEWEPLERLKEQASRDLALPYHDLKSVIDKYKKYYLSSKTTVKPGTISDMEVECRTILEILGNTGIAEANTMETLTTLKSVLRRYPLNRQQRYGNRSLASILKSETGYKVINPKTANNYISRMMAVIDFATKAKMVNTANVYCNERFATDRAAEEERSAYDNGDIVRLIDAICTYQLWIYGDPRPERFWIILICLFHGLRLGNVVSLTKRDICQTDKGTWIFRLRAGKTKSTVRPVAICDSLLLLGFLEWVEKLPRERLFLDTPKTFSMWYNRHEVQRNGKPSLGFESRYVTTDKTKCLYSLRHSFGGNVFDVTEDFKITADMMGHSTSRSVTARYTKATKAEILKEVTEKMHLEHIDLDKLEARARELFNHL